MRSSSSDNSTSSANHETATKKLTGRFKNIGSKLKLNIPKNFMNRPGRNSSTDEPLNLKFTDSQTEHEEVEQFQLEAIDRSAIRESDELFQDCSQFIQDADRTIQLAQKANGTGPLLKISSSLNKWRVKGKGNKLYAQYELLLSRCDNIEKQLKEFTDRSLNECASLMIQASYLRSRLNACVEFNKHAVELVKPKVEGARDYMRELESFRKQIELMIVFHDEVKKLKDNQVEPYVPWALRAAMNSSTPQIQIIAFDKSALEKRIKNIDNVVRTLDSMLQRDSKVYDKRVSDLSHCSRSLSAMEKLLIKLQAYKTIVFEMHDKERTNHEAVTKENPIFAAMKKENGQEDIAVEENQNQQDSQEEKQEESSENEENNYQVHQSFADEDQLPPVDFYDHSHCADCTCVISLGNDCSMNLAAIQHFAEDSTTRLHKLFSIREAVKDKARELEIIDWGENV